jgi:hypothetical protein
LIAVVVVLAASASAHSGAGDAMSGGVVPPDSPGGEIARCELRVGREASKFTKSILRCHQDVADGDIAPEDERPMCEDPALTRLTGTSRSGCESCTNHFLDSGARIYQLAGLDSDLYSVPLLPGIYCTGTTPFAGSGENPEYEGPPAMIPPDAPDGPIAKCERRIAKAVSRLFTAKFRCLHKLADWQRSS